MRLDSFFGKPAIVKKAPTKTKKEIKEEQMTKKRRWNPKTRNY